MLNLFIFNYFSFIIFIDALIEVSIVLTRSGNLIITLCMSSGSKFGCIPGAGICITNSLSSLIITLIGMGATENFVFFLKITNKFLSMFFIASGCITNSTSIPLFTCLIQPKQSE